MAINRTSPDIWQPALVDKIADLVGKEIITMWFDDDFPLRRVDGWGVAPRLAYDEEDVIDKAIERVMGKIRLIMPDEVVDKIRYHACLDDYMSDLDLYLTEKNLELADRYYKRSSPYPTIYQQMREVGHRVSDFV